MADIWRIVVTQNKDGKMQYDFAIATPQDAELAHSYMINLRKAASYDDTFKDALAPMFIENGEIKFSHPQYETKENQTKLKELSPRILAEFNKFRTQHLDWKSTFDDMPKEDLMNTIYKDVDIFKPVNSSQEDEKVREVAKARIRNTYLEPIERLAARARAYDGD